MALGASGPDILRMVLRQGAVLVAIGVTLGAGLGIGLGSLLEQLLFRVRPWDPPVLAGTFAVLSSAGFVACLLPARRAARVDPLIALRQD
jgi:ABC-type antimicrobial peptide transport system permease subunit